MSDVKTYTPSNTPTPIGPYNHIAQAGNCIMIGGVAGFDPQTGLLAGSDVGSQVRRILTTMSDPLQTAGSDLQHVLHINVFLLHMESFEEMNRAYAESMGSHRPARTVIGVRELPKSGVLVTMNLTAVAR
jgi:2-iminobutanoate/2-iminopropanoate deaminase